MPACWQADNPINLLQLKGKKTLSAEGGSLVLDFSPSQIHSASLTITEIQSFRMLIFHHVWLVELKVTKSVQGRATLSANASQQYICTLG